MNARDLLVDAAHRPVEGARQVLAGIDLATLHTQPGGTGNTIAWLLWHAARQADVQLAHLTAGEQLWTTQRWAGRLGVARGPESFGFGDSPEAVAGLRVSDAQALGDHLEAVLGALAAYAATLTDEALDDVVDTRWDPPTTRGVRLVSIIDDAAVHVGQAAYARGLIEGWRIGY